MSEQPGRVALPGPDAIAGVPAGSLPGLAVQLSALLALVTSRLVAEGSSDGRADRLLSIEEVAERTQLSTDYLYRHAKALPFTRRIGRKVMFSEAGLAKWLATRGR